VTDGGLAGAFDAVRFGAARTLDLHHLRPTAVQAAHRVETWLEERQLQGAAEVLVITGRGANSAEGISPVRAAVERRLTELQHRGVVREVRAHTAGAFVVQLAPLTARFSATRRRRDRRPLPAPSTPEELAALEPATRGALHRLAEAWLDHLGIRAPTPVQVEDEMRRQFARLTAGVPHAPWGERVLRDAIERALVSLHDDA
jgi:hypothetical protein